MQWDMSHSSGTCPTQSGKRHALSGTCPTVSHSEWDMSHYVPLRVGHVPLSGTCPTPSSGTCCPTAANFSFFGRRASRASSRSKSRRTDDELAAVSSILPSSRHVDTPSGLLSTPVFVVPVVNPNKSVEHDTTLAPPRHDVWVELSTNVSRLTFDDGAAE